MFNYDCITKEEIKQNNSNWPWIPDHPYRMLIVEGSGSGEANALLNLIHHEPDIDLFICKRSIWNQISIVD